MTLSIREQVLQAFYLRLQAVTGVTILRNSGDQVDVAPTAIMVDGGQERHTGAGGDGEVFGQDTYTLRVRVFGYVDAATDEALGGAISDLYAKIVAAILADPTLAGAAQYTREASSSLDDPDWDSDRGRRPNAAFAVNFEVEFVTRNGDPYNR